MGSDITDKVLGLDPPKVPSLAPLAITPTTQVRAEAETARRDLEQRLRQAGSRGASNRGIPQLQPLPNFQGPQLGAKLG